MVSHLKDKVDFASYLAESSKYQPVLKPASSSKAPARDACRPDERRRPPAALAPREAARRGLRRALDRPADPRVLERVVVVGRGRDLWRQPQEAAEEAPRCEPLAAAGRRQPTAPRSAEAQAQIRVAGRLFHLREGVQEPVHAVRDLRAVVPPPVLEALRVGLGARQHELPRGPTAVLV